jgi:hypothetical protein
VAFGNWGVISINTMRPTVKKGIGKCLEWVDKELQRLIKNTRKILKIF